ncbi:MAG TPA: hypothetical protein VF797_07810, partial [Noviherbaspirillum sp.]
IGKTMEKPGNRLENRRAFNLSNHCRFALLRETIAFWREVARPGGVCRHGRQEPGMRFRKDRSISCASPVCKAGKPTVYSAEKLSIH